MPAENKSHLVVYWTSGGYILLNTMRERLMALEAQLASRSLSLSLHTFLSSAVTGRKLLSRHVTQQSTIQFVISDLQWQRVSRSLSFQFSLLRRDCRCNTAARL